MRLYKRGKVYWADLREEGMGRRSTGTSNRKAAESNAKRMLEGIGNGHTLTDALRMAWDTHYADKKSARNVKSQMNRLGGDYGHVKLTDINSPMLAKWVDRMKAAGTGDKTINRYLAVLSKTLGLAAIRGWIDAVPVMPRRHETEGRKRVFTAAELEDMLRRTDGMAIGSLIVFLLNTGCRLGEACSIPPQERQAALATGKLTFWTTKGGKPRTVPLTPAAKEALADSRWWDWTTRDAQKRWAGLRAAMNMAHDREFVLHALRHTCASYLVNQGADIYAIQKLLGHSRVSVTEGYAHLNTEALDGLALCLESVSRPAYDPSAGSQPAAELADERACILEGFPSGQRDQTVNPQQTTSTPEVSPQLSTGSDGKLRRYLN